MYLKYIWYVLRHKWFVFRIGLRAKVGIIQLITHDWSKFLPRELIPYARYFYGVKTPETEQAFKVAWNYHQKTQPHHWQYWVMVNDSPSEEWVITSRDGGMSYFGIANADGEFCEMARRFDDGYDDAEWLARTLNRAPIALEMPEKYIREMVADWAGAGRAITGKWEVHVWYEKTRNKIILHDNTRAKIEALLIEILDRRKS